MHPVLVHCDSSFCSFLLSPFWYPYDLHESTSHTHHFSIGWWVYEPSQGRVSGLSQACSSLESALSVSMSAGDNIKAKWLRSCLQLESVTSVLSKRPHQPRDLVYMHGKARRIKGSWCMDQPYPRALFVSNINTVVACLAVSAVWAQNWVLILYDHFES